MVSESFQSIIVADGCVRPGKVALVAAERDDAPDKAPHRRTQPNPVAVD